MICMQNARRSQSESEMYLKSNWWIRGRNALQRATFSFEYSWLNSAGPYWNSPPLSEPCRSCPHSPVGLHPQNGTRVAQCLKHGDFVSQVLFLPYRTSARTFWEDLSVLGFTCLIIQLIVCVCPCERHLD